MNYILCIIFGSMQMYTILGLLDVYLDGIDLYYGFFLWLLVDVFRNYFYVRYLMVRSNKKDENKLQSVKKL